jgi:hypothetical protein
MIDLDTTGDDYSFATGLNTRGQAVGGGRLGSLDGHAYLWEPN